MRAALQQVQQRLQAVVANDGSQQDADFSQWLRMHYQTLQGITGKAVLPAFQSACTPIVGACPLHSQLLTN